MFDKSWMELDRLPLSEIALISAGKPPGPNVTGTPEKQRKRRLQYAVDAGELASCGELHQHPSGSDKGAHAGTLVRRDDFLEYSQAAGLDWGIDVSALWGAVNAAALQEELDRTFETIRKKNANAEIEKADPYRTGAQGRPTMSHFVETEFERRIGKKMVEPKLAAEARALQNWIKREHPNGPHMTDRTIENRIRSRYNKLPKNPTK